MGLCQSQQVALAKAEAPEQLMSNEIPQVDLSQPMTPFLLNVPQLLYPQSPKQEAPKQETPKQVRRLTPPLRPQEQQYAHLLLMNAVFIWP